MSANAARRFAWGLTAVTFVTLAVNLALRALLPESRGAADALLLLPVVMILGAVGGLVAARRPDNAYGWLLLAIAFLWLTEGLIVDLATLTVARGRSPHDLVVAIAATGGALGWGLFVTYGLLLYPTGSLPGRPWKVVGWAAGIGLALMSIGLGWTALKMGSTNTLAALTSRSAAEEEGLAEILNGIGHMLIFATMIAGAIGLFIRLRSAGTVERLQLKWFAYGASLAVLSILVQLTDLLGEHGAFLEIAAFTLLPAIIGIAVLRWRLYEIDRIVSRTLAYGLLTVLLGGIYLGAVTALTALTAPVTGDSPVAVAAATLLAAAAFGPARRRIQDAVDHRFNRARYDSQQMVEGFATRMRDEVDLDQLTVELHTVSTEALHPTKALLWLRPEGRR